MRFGLRAACAATLKDAAGSLGVRKTFAVLNYLIRPLALLFLQELQTRYLIVCYFERPAAAARAVNRRTALMQQAVSCDMMRAHAHVHL